MTASPAEAPDRLIWLAAGAIAALGLAWLLIEAPWSAAPEPALPAILASAPPGGTEPNDGTNGGTDGGAAAAAPEDPLYLARLALEAGMLIEPPAYSAWTLFGAAADADPTNAEAATGLEAVATALLGRGLTALEQGRLDDAESIAATITDRLPAHAGAVALARDIDVARRPPPPPVEPPRPRPAAAPAAPRPDERIPGLHADFLAALGRNAMLTPSGSSARDLVTEMIALAPEHELTIADRDMIVTEMLNRSVQSLEALDAVAAETWIDAAEPLAADPARIEQARERVRRQLIEAESRKLLPASALEQLVSAEPDYPEAALNRDIEGWVELEFVVSPAGSTESITIVDASHERYFREEAIAAVAQWRFRPVVFMGQAIPQRAHTRLSFVLD